MRHLQLTNYQQRLTLESWNTNSEQEPLNQCQQLHVPAPYKLTNNRWRENSCNKNRPITTTFMF